VLILSPVSVSANRYYTQLLSDVITSPTAAAAVESATCSTQYTEYSTHSQFLVIIIIIIVITECVIRPLTSGDRAMRSVDTAVLYCTVLYCHTVLYYVLYSVLY